MKFEKKIVWITGASSGIGEALATAFAAEGASIILSGRRTDALQAVADKLTANNNGKSTVETKIIPFETTDYDQLPARVEEALAFKGRVDILVNNAGISQRSLATETLPEVYQKIINVDLLAPIWLTQLLLPNMVAAGGGHIVAISSVAGRLGVPLRTAYSAAKHGLIGYMDSLRSETEQLDNIRVTNVLPGSVRTDVSRNALTADGKRRGKSDAAIDNGMEPGECAAEIVRAVAQYTPEIVLAEEPEKTIAAMRHSDPEQLFQIMSDLGTDIATKYRSAEDD